MKQATLDRRSLKWERDKYFMDKATAILLNPAGLLIAGFVATQYLQHKHMGDVMEDYRAWWKGPGLPPDGQRLTPQNFLTDTQANALRAGMVAAFASGTGVLDTLKGLFT